MRESATADLMIYELVMLQFRPDPSSGELLNVGVIGFSPDTRRLAYAISDRYGRLSLAYPGFDGGAYRNLVRRIRSRCAEVARDLDSDRLGLYAEPALSDLLNRIVPVGAANFVWSEPRFGACTSLVDRIKEVFEEYIAKLEHRQHRERKDDDELWKSVVEHPRLRQVLDEIEKDPLVTAGSFKHVFRGAWQNGQRQFVDSLSLDYAKPGDMRAQPTRMNGVVSFLRRDNEFGLVLLVTDRPTDGITDAYDDTIALLRSIDGVREVIPESRSDHLAEIIERDLASAH